VADRAARASRILIRHGERSAPHGGRGSLFVAWTTTGRSSRSPFAHRRTCPSSALGPCRDPRGGPAGRGLGIRGLLPVQEPGARLHGLEAADRAPTGRIDIHRVRGDSPVAVRGAGASQAPPGRIETSGTPSRSTSAASRRRRPRHAQRRAGRLPGRAGGPSLVLVPAGKCWRPGSRWSEGNARGRWKIAPGSLGRDGDELADEILRCLRGGRDPVAVGSTKKPGRVTCCEREIPRLGEIEAMWRETGVFSGGG
jgi:hypothetical protein